jgi:hypothetical protein
LERSCANYSDYPVIPSDRPEVSGEAKTVTAAALLFHSWNWVLLFRTLVFGRLRRGGVPRDILRAIAARLLQTGTPIIYEMPPVFRVVLRRVFVQLADRISAPFLRIAVLRRIGSATAAA